MRKAYREFRSRIAKYNRFNMNQSEQIINIYKDLITTNFLKEVYKWELIERFKGKPDLDSENFVEEMQEIKFSNLLYHSAKSVQQHLWNTFPEEYGATLKYLFNENLELGIRIREFQKRVSSIYKMVEPKLSHHHDERTIACFLSVKYPEVYPIYKSKYYEAYCNFLKIIPAKKNDKYLHYISLIKDLTKTIAMDDELISLVNSLKTPTCYADPEYLLLAQDILYQVFSNKASELYNEELKDASEIVFQNNMKHPLNQILYGPPGTGKTYNTINKAIAIANPEFDLNQDRSLIKVEYQRLVDAGQIVFTTFHQSMTYEDFIEGIKPVMPNDENDENFGEVAYDIESGLFKKLATIAKEIKTVYKNTIDFDHVDFYKMSLGGKNNPQEHAYCIENNVGGITYGGYNDLSTLQTNSHWTSYRDQFKKLYPDVVLESKYNIQASFILGKMKVGDIVIATKGNHVIDAIGRVIGDYFFDANTPTTLSHFRKIEWFARNLNLSPEKFFNKKISQQSIYQFYKEDVNIESFKQLTQENEKVLKNYVLIIDEINRGNVSQIFGELITLIEEDKRLGNDEVLEVILPYSKERFGVPSNLYIIGTMNTADRSVEALDTALRRRFVFEEMPPKYNLDGLQQELFGFKAAEILEKINLRIEKLLDRDHKIGHAYFINKNETTIIESFYKNIIPLLQEYFFGDYGKIGLVLGGGFIKKIEQNSVFANFEHLDFSQFEEKESYEIINHKNDPIGFSYALQLLMNC